MDEVSRPASERPSRSLDEQQNSLAAPPRRAASGASSDDAGSAAVARRTVGGRAVTIPPPPAAAAATAAFPGVGWTNEDISPQGAPLHTVAASSASSAAAAGDVIDVDDGDEDEYSYFGEFPNPDPTDDSPLDISLYSIAECFIIKFIFLLIYDLTKRLLFFNVLNFHCDCCKIIVCHRRLFWKIM